MEPSARREQILVSAMRLFEKQAYDQVSTADIATAAGIGRPLVHHYFGTKRELYLEVVRRLAYIPPIAAASVQGETLDERIVASIDRWLEVAWRHRNMWLSTITLDGGADREITTIVRQADDLAADRILAALQLQGSGPEFGRLRAHVLAYGGLARTASRMWLHEESLNREDVRQLLVATLRTILHEVVDAEPFRSG